MASVVRHNRSGGRRIGAAKEAAEADSLTVGTAAFEARYRKAIAEWKLVCDISDTDCE